MPLALSNSGALGLSRPSKGAFAALILASAALLLSACTTTLASNPDYVMAPAPGPAAMNGSAVIVMDDALQNDVITAHPTSYTGSATSIVEPIGQIIRDVGLKILGPAFSNGVTVGTTTKPDAYGVVLRLDAFSYQYDQLSNLGFAITPKVTVSMTIEAIGPDGKSLFRKTYERKNYTVGAYVASLEPAEKINKSLHLAIGEIFRDVVDDVKAARSRT